MHPIDEIDALLLLATTLAAKRRPAELAEIIAATDLLHGALPSEAKLSQAFARLSTHGLLTEAPGGYTLTAAAQTLMTGSPAGKRDAAAQLASVRDRLAAHPCRAEHAAIALDSEQLGAAIRLHRSTVAGPGKNLLMPKPKAADRDHVRPGQRQRKPLPKQRRRP